MAPIADVLFICGGVLRVTFVREREIQRRIAARQGVWTIGCSNPLLKQERGLESEEDLYA
jgi:hypothetical protein